MNSRNTSSVAKHILIIAGIAIIIYGFVKDADVVSLIGVAIFIEAFFLKQIINEFQK